MIIKDKKSSHVRLDVNVADDGEDGARRVSVRVLGDLRREEEYQNQNQNLISFHCFTGGSVCFVSI